MSGTRWSADRALRGRVLELGAGTGLLTEALVAAGRDVVAADVSAGMPARLAERLPGVPALVARAEQLPLPDDVVDIHPDTRGRAELDLDHVTSAWRLAPR